MSFGNPLIPNDVSELRKLNARAKSNTLNLGLGQPAIDMPPELRKLALQAIKKHKLGYTPNAGRADLRDSIGRLYGLNADSILVTHGAQEGLMAVLLALLKRGDEVLIPDPGFLAYATMVRIAGGKAKPYSLKSEMGFAFNVDKILASVSKKTKAVILCSPNNPTGTVISDPQRARLLKELSKRKVFLISDDVYAELRFDGKYSPVSKSSEFGVTVSSWSKSLALTGWRIGFVHTKHPELRARALAAHQYLVTCASSPAQSLMLEVLAKPALYRRIQRRFRDEYEAKLRMLCDALPKGARPMMPEGGFYLFVQLPTSNDTEAVDFMLEKKQLLVVPGSYFGKCGKGWVRVSVAADKVSVQRAALILSSVLRGER